MAPGESTIGAVDGPQHWIGLYTQFGALWGVLFDPNGATPFTTPFRVSGSTPVYPDGQWHYAAVVFLGSSSYQLVYDLNATTTAAFTGASVKIKLDNLFIESTTIFGDPVSEIAAANMALYPVALSSAQLTAHYQRGAGYLGELPGNRGLRLLTAYWGSNVVTDPGLTPLSADFYYDPPSSAGSASQSASVLGALEDVADTEGGLVWVDTGGTIHFDGRTTRYVKQPTSLFTFGENASGGELPYLEVEYDYDPTYVYSEADLTCDATGNVLVATNASSQAAYGQRILSKTLFARNDWDVQQTANFYAQRYAKPAGAPGTGTAPRISRLTLNPASNPGLFGAVLSLDIGSRVTVKRRTAAGVTISGDYYVEQVGHTISGPDSAWTVDYQLSPVFNTQVWILGDATNSVLGSTTRTVF
jgi:hypothetical protein